MNWELCEDIEHIHDFNWTKSINYQNDLISLVGVRYYLLMECSLYDYKHFGFYDYRKDSNGQFEDLNREI